MQLFGFFNHKLITQPSWSPHHPEQGTSNEPARSINSLEVTDNSENTWQNSHRLQCAFILAFPSYAEGAAFSPIHTPKILQVMHKHFTKCTDCSQYWWEHKCTFSSEYVPSICFCQLLRYCKFHWFSGFLPLKNTAGFKSPVLCWRGQVALPGAGTCWFMLARKFSFQSERKWKNGNFWSQFERGQMCVWVCLGFF